MTPNRNQYVNLKDIFDKYVFIAFKHASTYKAGYNGYIAYGII